MCVNLFLRNLNPDLYPLYTLQELSTCKVTITLRVCGDINIIYIEWEVYNLQIINAICVIIT